MQGEIENARHPPLCIHAQHILLADGLSCNPGPHLLIALHSMHSTARGSFQG